MAEGAVSHYLDRFVVRHLVRYTYGTPASIKYDPSDPEHRKRSHKKYLGVAGGVRLDVFSPTLFKVTVFAFGLRTQDQTNYQGTRVSGTQEFRDDIAGVSRLPPIIVKTMEFPVIRYTGTSKNPRWMDEDPGGWTES